MLYVYRCEQCRITSEPAPRHAVREARAEHRRRAHGGMIPDGEELAALPRRPFRWRTVVWFYFVLLVVWPAVDWLWRQI